MGEYVPPEGGLPLSAQCKFYTSLLRRSPCMQAITNLDVKQQQAQFLDHSFSFFIQCSKMSLC